MVRFLLLFSLFSEIFKKPKQKCFEVEVGCFETFEKEKQYKINLGPHITCGGFEKGRGEKIIRRGGKHRALFKRKHNTPCSSFYVQHKLAKL